MKKLSIVLACSFALVFAASCAKKATPEACKEACAKAVELQKAAAPQDEAAVVNPVQKVTEEFQVKLQELQKVQGEAIAAIQTECDTAAAALTKEEEKTAAAEACSTKKNEKAQEMAPQFVELNQAKVEALKVAEEAKAKMDAEALAATEKAIADCTDAAVKARTTETKAACQIAATNLDEFNVCK